MPFISRAALANNITPLKKGGQLSHRFKLSLNAYSFNGPLTKKEITIQEVIDFCGALNLDAIDLTGYYLENYPNVPSDEYIYGIKQKVHKAGLSISGTGIRNDFGSPDPIIRLKEVEFVKSWINVAAKLGAPVIRIYSAKSIPKGYNWEETAAWILDCFKLCVAYGKKMGVIVAMQNHNDFITTAKQAIYFSENLDPDWFGLVVDTGNFQTNNAYEEIKLVANYAVNWQVKELVTINGTIEPMDLSKLMKIIAASNYKGYLPTETLSPGDPKQILPPFLNKVHEAILPYM
jgi:sugar phosphate isomerase/epimerase